MIYPKAKNDFWMVVEHCLVEFHGFRNSGAHEKAKELRKRIEAPPTGMSSEISYHAEPFDVACDIADKRLDISKYGERYGVILKQHNW